MSDALKSAVSGLNDSVLRLATAANNIANASSTGRLPATPGESATSYAPQDVVTLSNASGDNALGVRSVVVARSPAYTPAYDPTSSNANAAGLVAAPNVDIAAELVNSKIAAMTYRANAAIIKAAAENDKTLLDSLA